MSRYKKRKDGLYQANIKVGYNPTTGHPKYKTVYARTVNELEIKKADVKSAVTRGVYADDQNILLGEWAESWFELERSNDSPKTKEMYKNLVFTHIKPGLGHIRLRELKKSDIQGLINQKWNHPRICTQIVMCLNQILNAAIDENYLYRNVCKKIKKPRYNRTPQRALSDDEKYALFHADFTCEQRAFLLILFYCGLRREEVLALNKSNIDLKNNTLTITNAVTYDDNIPILKDPKTFNSYRELYIPLQLQETLKAYLPNVKDYLFVMKKPNLKLTDPVQQRLMSKSSYNKYWRQLIKKMNSTLPEERHIENLSSRIFRYNYATMLYYSGVDIKEAQQRMGHSDVKLTLDIYTALDSNQSNANKKFQEYLNKTNNNASSIDI